MTKKPLAIILAFFIVFSPVYSYAVLPALIAAAASAGGRVLVGNTIKRVGQAALSKAGMASIAAGVASTAGIKSAIESDGWSIDYGSGGGGAGGSWDAPDGVGVDSQGNIDIEIYKIPPNDTCEVKFAYGDNKDSASTHANDVVTRRTNSEATFRLASDWKDEFDKLEKYWRLPENKSQLTNEFRIMSFVTIKMDRKGTGSSDWSDNESYWFYTTSAYVGCFPYPSNKNYITNNEFNAYLTKNITVNNAGDVIKNIYNYDYSQHPNITINNNTTGGNSLNNDLSINADPELRVSPRLRLDIESNKVNLDNVNDENCTKNEAGEYDNCTGEPDPEEEETDPDDPNNPSPEEPPPIECSANGFYKKICDWMDWTKENPTPSEEAPVDIKNIEAESTNKIDMAGECPSPYELNFTIAGYAQNNSISYEPLCGALEMLKPIFIGSGALSGMFILMGYSRPSGTGAN